MRRAHLTMATIALAAAVLPLPGCGGPAEPVVVSREALGTVVSVTAYGEDQAAVEAAVEAAFGAMAEVEHELDAYDAASAVSAFNADPYTEQALPEGAVIILDAVDAFALDDEFSPALLGVSRLYDFGGTGRVPSDFERETAVALADGFVRTASNRGAFTRIAQSDPRLEPGGELAPGLDFGGAAKGLALDRARDALRQSGAVSAALITAGSTSVTLGTKPDGDVWRIGVEDPRKTGTVVAVFQLEGDGALSTSGEYQQAFESDGVVYHHILDPATGMPARGMRSLTVAGTGISGLQSDILSTALFVKGSGNAAAYAQAAGVALYIVDDEGRALVVPAPEISGVTVAERARPQP
jgi:thiamine biosynthesis lipoprotein